MIDAGQQRAELLAVVDDAADRDAAEADAVIAALAADQPHPRRIAADIVKSQRDLERGVDRFRAGIAKEHMIEIAGRQRRDARRQFERLGMGELERRRVIELGRLARNGGDNGIAIMAGIAAPKAGGAVEHAPAVRRDVVHVLGGGDQPRALLEGAVGRERHPIRFEIVGNACGTGRLDAIGFTLILPQRWRHSATICTLATIHSRPEISFRPITKIYPAKYRQPISVRDRCIAILLLRA